ncbi:MULTISPECIES: permease-like cell division protein FtsX [Carboxydothermus]|uniref:Cell division protein FtsX n=2 Tax=Carboxydothermus TaxID=129957 RepID=Q3AFP4_CARHZ|nr:MULTISPECIES: permease-like cell division protein FtsX [Carboxydothermus]ABB14417.1 cell division protein FtsX [Carboxydothermus hydrogenoformans Z-2901]NYE57417.1 cell division transport system permease protein [Carboxydothermus ferrireducens DSM 11255]
MSLNLLSYYFKEAFKSIFRNSFLSLASVMVVFITIFILGVAVLLIINAGYLADTLQNQLEIYAYLKTGDVSIDTRALEDKIKAIEGVASVKFIPKEEGLRKIKEKLGDRADILAGIEERNPLPDAYLIKTKRPEDVPIVGKKLATFPEFETVKYGQGIVEKLLKVTTMLKIFGLGIISLFGFGAVLLIMTTIRLAIFSRRKEIEIARILGATNWFVRMPFIIEGTFLGLTGSLFAAVLVAIGYYSLLLKVSKALPFLVLFRDQQWLTLTFAALVGSGGILGLLGSILSLNKYLKF